MTTNALLEPLAFVLDDGIHIFQSAADATQWFEPIDVRNHPEWFGYDSRGNGLRLDIVHSHRTLAFGLKSDEEHVEIRIDSTRDLNSDDVFRASAIEHLQHAEKKTGPQISDLTNRQLLGLLAAQKQL